eukprot:12869434-Prorocentrum_lima.AAC.1
MTSSLVGSEMCIRDREYNHQLADPRARAFDCEQLAEGKNTLACLLKPKHCLLYTSDAADDM